MSLKGLRQSALLRLAEKKEIRSGFFRPLLGPNFVNANLMNATFANTWLAPADRFRQGCSINDTARYVVAFRIRQENPSLSRAEASRMALQRAYQR